MKKTTLHLILFFVFTLYSCGNQTITSYNNTIVVAHDELLKINNEFYNQMEKMLGNPKADKAMKALIATTKLRILEARKPVDELVEIKDHGLRETMLDMFTFSENAMARYALKTETFTNPNLQFETTKLIAKEYKNLITLDNLIRELQTQYAYYNNAQLQ